MTSPVENPSHIAVQCSACTQTIALSRSGFSDYLMPAKCAHCGTPTCGGKFTATGTQADHAHALANLHAQAR